MVKYVLGFAFDSKREWVALIEKQRPKWQAGKLNGLGGHIEPSDTHVAAAMEREFLEESGVLIPAANWKPFANLIGPGWAVRCFKAFSDEMLGVKTTGDERVGIFNLANLRNMPEAPITNLKYLIPLALDDEECGVPTFHYGPK